MLLLYKRPGPGVRVISVGWGSDPGNGAVVADLSGSRFVLLVPKLVKIQLSDSGSAGLLLNLRVACMTSVH